MTMAIEGETLEFDYPFIGRYIAGGFQGNGNNSSALICFAAPCKGIYLRGGKVSKPGDSYTSDSMSGIEKVPTKVIFS